MSEEFDPLATFEHVVVLMLENRSFDNLLGYLYPSEQEGRAFEGLEGKKLFNDIPLDLVPPPESPNDGDTESAILAKKRFTSYHSPFPDPGEEFPHINRQLWYPDSAPEKGCKPKATMSGFVADYVVNYPKAHASGPGQRPDYAQYRTIMDSYPADRVPVLSELAKGFAVFDHWHCSVPSQTWCNRAFWHAATSYGRVINGPSLKWLCGSKARNLFTRLSKRFGDPTSRMNRAKRSAWRIYSPFWNFVSLTVFLHLRSLFRYDDDEHVRDLDRFFEDCRLGELPRYSFLEPMFLFRHNDQHPSSLTGLEERQTHEGSVILGERLILDIYNAIRTSSSKVGNNSQNTLLIITHDEHGGCYDHIAPECAVPPKGGRQKAGECGFMFDRLGVRVPMVMVSAHIKAGTIVSETHDHTSFLRTMEKKWDLEPLTERDAAAKSFEGVFTPTPRPSDEWPRPVLPEPPEAWDQHEAYRNEGLHGMQRNLLQAAALVHGISPRRVRQFQTLGETHDYMRAHVWGSRRRKRGPWRIFFRMLFGWRR